MNYLILTGYLLTAHWLADWTVLSTPWMLNAKKFGKPLFPILCHAGVQAGMMAFVFMFAHLWMRHHGHSASSLLPYVHRGTQALLLQLVTHWIIDIGKGRLAFHVPITGMPQSKWFWTIMGFDQLLHQIVILAMVWMVLR